MEVSTQPVDRRPRPGKLLRNEVWAPPECLASPGRRRGRSGRARAPLPFGGDKTLRRARSACANHRDMAPSAGDRNCAALILPGPRPQIVAETKARAQAVVRTRCPIAHTSRSQQSTRNARRRPHPRESCDTHHRRCHVGADLRWRSLLVPRLNLRVPGPGTPIRAAGEGAPPVRARSLFAATRLATVIVPMALGRTRRQEMRWGWPG
jgi:hypothetical protein